MRDNILESDPMEVKGNNQDNMNAFLQSLYGTVLALAFFKSRLLDFQSVEFCFAKECLQNFIRILYVDYLLYFFTFSIFAYSWWLHHRRNDITYKSNIISYAFKILSLFCLAQMFQVLSIPEEQTIIPNRRIFINWYFWGTLHIAFNLLNKLRVTKLKELDFKGIYKYLIHFFLAIIGIFVSQFVTSPKLGRVVNIRIQK